MKYPQSLPVGEYESTIEHKKRLIAPALTQWKKGIVTMADEGKNLGERISIGTCVHEKREEDRCSYQFSHHIDEYKQVREEIHSEYTLMANRVNWLLASQTFLFTALAIATPKDVLTTPDLSKNIFYTIAPVIGLFSCWLIASSITANILRIWDWKRIQRDILKKIEYLAPQLPRDSLPGFGLLPPVGLPLLFFSLWGYLLFVKMNLFFESRVIFAVFFACMGILSVWSSAFFFHCLDEETSYQVFKRPINFVKEHRRKMFFITILVFLAMAFYAIFF